MLETTHLYCVQMEHSVETLVDVSKPRVRELGIRACLPRQLKGFRRNKLILCERQRDRRGKRSSSKLLISDRESSLSSDSISVE